MKTSVGKRELTKPGIPESSGNRVFFILPSRKQAVLLSLFIFFSSFFFNGHSYSQSQSFRSSKIKVISYGTREQTSTITPNIVNLNLQDSLITITPGHIAVNEFLNFQNQFEVTQVFGKGATTRVIFTSSEYLFTFDTRMRVVAISKKEISPMIHSVWLEEISD